MEHEALLALIENGIAKDIGGQEVAGKLDALKCERQRASQCLGQRCFADARNVFD